MYFRILLDEASGLISYLMADLEAAEAVLIDPRPNDEGVIRAMLHEYRLGLVRALCTDGHGCAQAPLPSDGELVTFGAEHIRVVATPGHTERGLSFLWRDRLFCGGLLAPLACPEAPGLSSPADWWDSAHHKVLALPAETLLFSGHAAAEWSVSNVLTQRRRHPWFAGLRRDEALARMHIA